ncbi:MAG: hypothetical protein K2G77_04075, partial [Muribaculaceae bacterium]|nr:hypothetical protein [Muribaculaceae bacterium]
MKKKLDILNWFMLLIVLFSTACGYDDLVVSDVYEEEPPTPYVELLISVPSVNPTSTRANPVAGEEGNGREHGVYNEDKIHDINIFFYKDVNGLDGEDDSKILHHIYFNLENPSDKDNSTLLQETSPIFEKNYLKLQFGLTDKFQELVEGSKFAAIANIGPIQEGEITNLKQLRELDVSAYSNTWSERYDEFSVNAEKMDYFLMSTAYNINYKYGDY